MHGIQGETSMPRPSTLWFRKSNHQWYTTIRGQQIALGSDKKKALAEYHRLMASGESSEPRKRGLLTTEILDLWLGAMEAKVKPISFKSYLRIAQSFASHSGRVRAADLRPLHISQWIKKLELTSKTSQSNYVAVVKMAFRWATAEGWLEKDPIALMRKPGVKPRQPAEQGAVEKLLASNLPPHLRHILEFMAGTGCRPGEAMTVEASRIDFQASTVMVDGKRGKRLVVLSEPILKLLADLSKTHSDGPIFRDRFGKPWNDKGLTQAVARAGRKAGVWLTASHFRKHFATSRIAAGVDSAIVAKLLGHKDTASLNMLIKHYFHPDIAELKKAVEA
jgi:integrase